MTTPERKYALSRVKAGDYLLLSNDGQTLWRIASYAEDGSASYADTGEPITGTFWGLWRYKGRDRIRIDVDEWNDFDFSEGMHRKRADAIRAALR